MGAEEGKANALGGQCAGALAGLAHLRGFKGPEGVTKTKSSNIFLITTKIRESTIFRFFSVRQSKIIPFFCKSFLESV